MNIAVFCSANENIDPDFFTMAEKLGRKIALKGHTLVYGGVNAGLMERIGKAVHENGGKTIGVIPQILEKNGKISEYMDVHIPCDNLSDRKDMMLLHSDMAIALPGGIGTLDEVFTMAASSTIGYHHKLVIMYNMKGFWDSLKFMLDDLQQKGVIRGNYSEMIRFSDAMPDL